MAANSWWKQPEQQQVEDPLVPRSTSVLDVVLNILDVGHYKLAVFNLSESCQSLKFIVSFVIVLRTIVMFPPHRIHTTLETFYPWRTPRADCHSSIGSHTMFL